MSTVSHRFLFWNLWKTCATWLPALLDVYLSTIGHRVNLEVRTLTVVATIFMPAT